MKYLKLDIQHPVEYLSGGRFVTEVPWTHTKRTIDSYEIIIGINETLYIEQEGIQYEVKPGQVLFLLPNHTHQGFQICNKNLSFYWFHFLCDNGKIDDQMLNNKIINMRTHPDSSRQIKDIYIPSYASPSAIERVNILANQLLHVDNSNYYTRMSMNYLMTSLLIELSEQTISELFLEAQHSHNDMNLNQILEWTRINVMESITVADIAEKFNYHKDYLSRFFKRKTGITLQEYFHILKLSKAKDLLTGTRMNIKEISYSVGITDEKYFMRLFKNYEKITPTEYRKAYYKVHYNNR